MVSELAFNLDDASSNPADVYSFFSKKLCLKRTKMNKKEAEVSPYKRHDSKDKKSFGSSFVWNSKTVQNLII